MKLGSIQKLGFVVLCISLYSTQLTLAADPREQLKEAKTKKSSVLQEIAETNKEMAKYTQKIEEAKTKFDRLQEELAPIEEEYTRAELEKERVNELFKKRIRFLYKQGEYNFLASLFSSASINQFLIRFEMLRMIEKADYRLLQDRRRTVNEAEVKKKKYDQALQKLQKVIDESRKAFLALSKELSKNKDNLKDIEKVEELYSDEVVKINLREWNNGTLRFNYTGPFIRPVDGASITSPWGYRRDPYTGRYSLHAGVDFGAAYGTPVKAVADGVVISSRPSSGYGWLIIIYHGELNGRSVFTRYGHSYPNQVEVKVGEQVSVGDIITHVGSNGWSTGPHLHLELRFGDPNAPSVNPMSYFK